MSRIHPHENKSHDGDHVGENGGPAVLTVWKKSSMAFQGTDGFSVYDGEGKLVFRVDNYSRKNRWLTGGLVLMDGVGKPLMTLKPQTLSMHDRWNGFEGEECSKRTPAFSMRKRWMVHSKDCTEVFMTRSSSPDFLIEGCFQKRCCKVMWGQSRKVVAEICRKKANASVTLSDDVFSLVVQPCCDRNLIMAIVVVMDRICRKSFTPFMCS
ncbi:Protein LURP-one-related 8 [Acorus calamus]|uniref:Protein LURP-one-related 8 n=1 Tax=Acorus calamus TaxID=4465 RepID=A0AAV9F9E6_ACOCL|nr:Protein LURP-one-related 8 [Acorus calamus]